jgi:hypothetical protein
MLIKKADDKTGDVETLRALAARPDASADTRKKIEQEIRNIQSGMKGEAEAAYEMGFHYGESKNWMVLHDLRLECGGRVAQIDHLLINRFLEIYVCESKRFSEGVAINEQGEFAAFFGSKPYGIASPLEQNRRHMAVLEAVFKTGQVAPPKRLGFTITPSLHGLVLVSKTARISRPKAKIDGIEMVIKNDQLKAKIDRDIDKDNNILGAAKLIGQDTLEDFARRLAAAHEPIRFDWAAKFGLPAVAPAPVVSVKAVAKEQPVAIPVAAAPEVAVAVAQEAGDGDKKSKLACSTCGTIVAYNIAKFCWFNKPRFGGKVFCMECQKAVPAP